MHRAITAAIDAQAVWAKPVGDKVQGWLVALFQPYQEIKDALNGTWLGHPVHPMVTDVPVGAMTVSALLDLTGQDAAADLAMATGLAGMVASVPTGAADAVDAFGRPLHFATVHATLMVASASAYLTSFGLRLASRRGRGRGLARLLAYAGYASLAAGAYVGGDLVFKLGNQVDRHAWARTSKQWKKVEVGDLPEGTLVRGMLGSEPLVMFRQDGEIHALHATCAHAGGQLNKGALINGCVECPLHQSRFRMTDGAVVQGPAVYDQPAYEVRAVEGGYEARLLTPAST